MAQKQYAWFDGKFVNFDDAKVHFLTHSLQYGSGIFEGIRAYKAKDGTAVFRLKEHMRRFFRTAKIYSMVLGYRQEELSDAICELIKKNKLESAYIRPFAFYNDQKIGLGVMGKKVSVAIAAIDFGSYFANREKGLRCLVSSWHRITSDILPPHAKASGNYINSILASMEAKTNGADEAIMLTSHGYVAEGPGENIFLVNEGKLATPSGGSDILMGITRDSIINIAEALGIEMEEREMHREELYTADEVFFSGTAAEVTPITSIDNRKVGSGKMGPVTKTLADYYFDVVTGKKEEFKHWLKYI